MRRQPTKLSTFLLALCALLLAFGAVPVTAQGGAAAGNAPADGGFSEVIDVRVINLEVVVEDKDGVRVHDLKPEDFELLVDGSEVPIEYFTEVIGGVAVARQGDGTDATVPAQVPGEPVSTSYLLFIDDYFSIARDRDRVLDNLVEQLPNIRSQDQMAVVAFDGKGVEMLSNWTSSVNALTRTLKEAQRRDAGGLLRLAERRTFRSEDELIAEGLSVSGGTTGVTALGDLSPQEEFYARLLAGQVERGIMAATATLRSFAQPPGRKVMLLLSGGWPADPVHFVVTDPVRASTQTRVSRDGQLLGPLVETANRLGYTLYPIDVPGIEPTGVDASVSTLDVASFRQYAGGIREQEHQATLYRLAKQTGGKALVNSLRNDALERVVADIQSYYWIGFTPNWQGDDSVHDVQVSVRGTKYDIRTRENFSDLSRSTEIDMMVESTLRFGGAPGGIPLTAEVGRGKSAGWGKREVPLRVGIPLDALTFLPTAEGYQARAEMRIAVLDEAGETADIPVIPLQLTAKSPPTDGEMLPYETALKMRNKRHDLVVSIYDNASGRILSAKLEVREK